MNSTSIKVRNTAKGSLLPDSASSVAPTRGRRRRPCACTSRNTAAASVEATTAPTSSASVQLRSSAYFAAGAVIAAVSEHADGRKHHRGRQHRADALKPRAQSAVEQDQRQRHRADKIGRPHVVELQLPGTGIAGQDADEQEHQQQRRAEAQREQARQDAGHDKHGAEQNGYADLVERSHAPSKVRANTCICILIAAMMGRQPIFRREQQSARKYGLSFARHGVVSMAAAARLWDSGTTPRITPSDGVARICRWTRTSRILSPPPRRSCARSARK